MIWIRAAVSSDIYSPHGNKCATGSSSRNSRLKAASDNIMIARRPCAQGADSRHGDQVNGTGQLRQCADKGADSANHRLARPQKGSPVIQ